MIDLTRYRYEIAGLALDAVIVFFLNRWYKSRIKDANMIKVNLCAFLCGVLAKFILHCLCYHTVQNIVVCC